MTPHVRPLKRFLSRLRSYSGFPCRPQKGRDQAMPGKVSTTREPRWDDPPKIWRDLTECTPPTSTEVAQVCATQPTPVLPPFVSRSSRNQEVKKRGLCPMSTGQRKGGPGSARSQGEESALSVHQGLPIPAQREPTSP